LVSSAPGYDGKVAHWGEPAIVVARRARTGAPSFTEACIVGYTPTMRPRCRPCGATRASLNGRAPGSPTAHTHRSGHRNKPRRGAPHPCARITPLGMLPMKKRQSDRGFDGRAPACASTSSA